MIPGLGRSPGIARGNPLQYSYLENPMDRRAWWAIVQSVAKSRIWLRWLSTHRFQFRFLDFNKFIVFMFVNGSLFHSLDHFAACLQTLLWQSDRNHCTFHKRLTILVKSFSSKRSSKIYWLRGYLGVINDLSNSDLRIIFSNNPFFIIWERNFHLSLYLP